MNTAKNKISVSPKDVKQMLKNSNNGFILLDIREKHEYDDWNIKGSVNMPLNSMIAAGMVSEVKEKFKTLPEDKEIIAVCARGINSQLAVSMLRDLNYNAVFMEKGMKGWNENFDMYEIEFTDFVVTQFVRIGKGCLSYIVYSKKDNSAAIFDPSIFTYEYTDYVKNHSLNVKYVIDTHSHADHFSGAKELSKTLGTDYYINNIDVDSSFEHKPLSHLNKLSLGDIETGILITPGHTDGSLSFLINNHAFICGDLLLLESPGRPDLARGKAETIAGAKKLYDSVQNVVLKLGDYVKIFPAHFTTSQIRPVTLTLTELKEQNKALTIADESDFVNFITENIPVTPPNYEAIKKYNKAVVIVPMDYAEDLEIGPNRCAAR